MIKIRLARGGKKNQPFYRIVAIEHTRKRGGKPLDVLGFWNPAKEDVKIDKEKLKNWLDKGAKTSNAVDELINKK